MEQRVAEIEKYLGIEDYEQANTLSKMESLEKKSQRIEKNDIVKGLDDKHYIIGELFSRYEAMEGFLKRTTPGS